MRLRSTSFWSVLLLIALSGLSQPTRATPPIVAAASNLKFVLETIAEAYTANSGQSVRLLFGSSGNFYRQIRQGAPYQIYISADENYVLQLQNAGLTKGNSFVYGEGRLVYFAPTGSTLNPSAGMADLQQASAENRITRFAIANPAHAPYGKAAMSTLENLGLDPAIRPVLVMGENVSQAAQFAISGSTDGGLFAYSLVFSDQVAERGRYALVPANLHPPLRQRATLLKTADQDALRFYQFMQSDTAQRIFAQYGFDPGAE